MTWWTTLMYLHSDWFFEFSEMLYLIHEITTIDKFHDQVKAELVLEGIVQSHDEGVLNPDEDLSLCLDAHIIICLKDQRFLDDFHGEKLIGLLVLDQQHLTKGALANDLEEYEVFLLGRRLFLPIHVEDIPVFSGDSLLKWWQIGLSSD